MKLEEKHHSIGVLKDGTRLEGYCYWVETGKGMIEPRFNPKKVQPDGSHWIGEEAAKRSKNLPHTINVYKHIMLNTTSFDAIPPAGLGLEPAMVKILLGMMYLRHGRAVVSRAGFQPLRNCLSGALDPRVAVSWVESLEAFRSKTSINITSRRHIVWGACNDARLFKSGVSLFGCVIAEIVVEDFGEILPGQYACVELPWLPR